METPKTNLSLVKRGESYKIIIPKKVEDQIRFLCSQVWTTEWSGVLFYTPEGSFEEDNLVIHCVDIFPMDIGNATYTEFDMNPDVIGYMAQNPELLDCQEGLIHSHNNMSTFFSGTDTDTLRAEGADRNHFVSLIVNNAGSYTAGITRKVTYSESRKISYPTYGGDEVSSEEEFAPKTEIEWFNLKIEFEEERTEDKFQEMAKRLGEIKKIKETKTASTPITPSTHTVASTPSEKYNASMWTAQFKHEDPELFDFDSEFAESAGKYTPVSYTKQDAEEKKLSKLVTPELIRALLFQLLTGNITVNGTSKIEIAKWIPTMDRLFDSRFGKAQNAYCTSMKFTTWATGYIEFLVWYEIDDPEIDEDSAAAYIAELLAKELNKLPSTNKYIEEYKALLADYERLA